MNWESSRDRRRSTYRTGRPQEVHKDAVLSVMLAQITICIILLAIAYSIKLTGLPAFQSARKTAGELLSKEMDFSFLDPTLSQWNLEVPVWLGRQGQMPVAQPDAPDADADLPVPASGEEQDDLKPAADPALDGSGDADVSADLDQPDGADGAAQAGQNTTDLTQENRTEASQTDGETAAQDAAGLDPELQEYLDRYLPEGGTDADSKGQGGGVNPVQLVSGQQRLNAPGGTTLAPFFLTDQPILPIKTGTLTCAFGYRTHPITGNEDFHTGVDIAAVAGAPISAVLAGTVSEVGESPFYGNYIVVRHSSGLETAYCHCSQILAPVGAVVRQREVIAKVGSTGMSTGSHVHLEFRINGQQANPAWVYDEF